MDPGNSWKKPDTKAMHLLYDSIYMKYPEHIRSSQNRQIYREMKRISGYLELGSRGRGKGEWLLIGTGFHFWDDENALTKVIYQHFKLLRFYDEFVLRRQQTSTNQILHPSPAFRWVQSWPQSRLKSHERPWVKTHTGKPLSNFLELLDK